MVDTAQLTRVYKKIRTARRELAKKFKKDDDKLKADLDMVSMAMMKHLISTNSESTRTDEGTFYKQIENKAYASDWNAVYAFIMEDPSRFEFLEKRLKVTEVVAYRDTHTIVDENGNKHTELPPGVTLNSEWVIRVRKSNTDNSEDNEGEG